MVGYTAPLRDMRFVLYELMDGDELTRLPGCEQFTRDLIDAVLAEAAKFCEHVLHPINRSGDEEGCAFENGAVRTPRGFREAYRRFCQGGWTSLGCDPVYGGQGLPQIVNLMVQEMICSANLSFGIYPGLSYGVYAALREYGGADLKETYLPRLVDGSWTGAMCLTEPHCGSDLGLLRTKAAPKADGSYSVTGAKIFISAGDHDLTDNIIYLVLARLPDAPKGIKGISLFLVPKLLPGPDGTQQSRNSVACGGIEHKMGIKASSTCVMNFDEASGWLVGERHKGMRAMFTMMNAARLSVGVQGLGLAEASHQGAVAYARQRLQGRAPSGPRYPDRPADPLIVHPDVRRMLLTQRAFVEGCRALAAWTVWHLDLQQRHPDPTVRQGAEDFVSLMTPVVKALLTDLGFEATNLGMQVMGGHGYVREHGMEQYVRDCRIAQIYEGTNGIQALDLLGRKLPLNAGRLLRQFFHPVVAYIERKKDDPALSEFIAPLEKAVVRLQQATVQLARAGRTDPEEAAAAASEYLRLFGMTALAYLWARMAEAAIYKKDDPDRFYAAKAATARFYFARILPQTGALFAAIMAGGKTITKLEDAAF